MSSIIKIVVREHSYLSYFYL